MTTAEPQTKRRWFRFSLKSLLVVMTVMAVWLGLYVKKFRDRREAILAIERFEGVVRYQQSGPTWLRQLMGDEKYCCIPFSVEFHWIEHISDEDLPQIVDYLVQFEDLKFLKLAGTSITDAGLVYLLPLSENLATLDIRDTSVSDDGVVFLTRFAKLRKLRIQSTLISTDGIAELRRALPKCRISVY